MSLGVINLLVAGFNVPNTPWGDDLHVGGKCLDGKLKANLIIAFTSAAVADSVCTLLKCNSCKVFCNDRTCKRCAKHIAFITSAGFECRDDEIIDKLVGEVKNIKF